MNLQRESRNRRLLFLDSAIYEGRKKSPNEWVVFVASIDCHQKKREQSPMGNKFPMGGK